MSIHVSTVDTFFTISPVVKAVPHDTRRLDVPVFKSRIEIILSCSLPDSGITNLACTVKLILGSSKLNVGFCEREDKGETRNFNTYISFVARFAGRICHSL